MDKKEFFIAYAMNLMEAFETQSIDFDCAFCPLRDKCRESEENGDRTPCNMFIRKQVAK